MSKEFNIFLGYADDASEQIELIKELKVEIDEFIQETANSFGGNESFYYTKFFEWRNNAPLDTGGQEKKINPHIKKTDLAIFIFRSRVGTVTKKEIELARNLNKNIICIFPNQQIYSELMMENNIDFKILGELEEYKKSLTKDWTDSDSKSVTPVNNYDNENLKDIVIENVKNVIKNYYQNPKDKENDIITLEENNIKNEEEIPKVCIYTASPLNNKIDHKINSILKLFKKYKLDITHKVLNENDLLEYKEFDYNLIFSKTNKEKIIIEDEYFMQKSITLDQLEELIDRENTILFLNNIIENSQFDLRKNINKNIVNFLYENFYNSKGISKIHPLKTELPYDIDITKLNGFVGRENDIESIVRKILTIRDENKILNIKGAGGLGKTTIISKVASEMALRGKYKDGIEFVRCEYINDYESFENKITFAFSMSNARNFKDQLKSLYDDEDRLIILDNIETLLHLDDTEEIKELIHFISNFATIVVTSRELLKENGFEEVYPIKEFSTDEAEELFINISKIKKYNKKQLRIEILEELLNNNPLAITLVANNLSKGNSTSQIKKELDIILYL